MEPSRWDCSTYRGNKCTRHIFLMLLIVLTPRCLIKTDIKVSSQTTRLSTKERFITVHSWLSKLVTVPIHTNTFNMWRVKVSNRKCIWCHTYMKYRHEARGRFSFVVDPVIPLVVEFRCSHQTLPHRYYHVPSPDRGSLPVDTCHWTFSSYRI